jgi:biotin synthase-like enzyme
MLSNKEPYFQNSREVEKVDISFEQGPIRPPSEANSLLLRLVRNCPWGRCKFCYNYRGERFEIRTVEELKKEITAIKEISDTISELSVKHGQGGEINKKIVDEICRDNYPQSFRTVAHWLYHGGKTVFLQDANSLTMKTPDLVEVLTFLKTIFPTIERITSYARSKTVAQKKVEDLKTLHQAGLSRLHIGLESGSDIILTYMNKGVSAGEHVKAGRKVKESGISLSEYVIIGLGGKKWWKEDAIETAKVLNQINPDFIRVRTLAVLPVMPLYHDVEEGDFVLSTEEEMIREERLFIENLQEIDSYLVSDHILNLLEEVEGKLPEDKGRMISVIDRYLALPFEEKMNFHLGRRMNLFRRLDDLNHPVRRKIVSEAMKNISPDTPERLDKTIQELRGNYI